MCGRKYSHKELPENFSCKLKGQKSFTPPKICLLLHLCVQRNQESECVDPHYKEWIEIQGTPFILLHFQFFVIKYIIFKILLSAELVNNTRLFSFQSCCVLYRAAPRLVVHFWPAGHLCDKLINRCFISGLGNLIHYHGPHDLCIIAGVLQN